MSAAKVITGVVGAHRDRLQALAKLQDAALVRARQLWAEGVTSPADPLEAACLELDAAGQVLASLQSVAPPPARARVAMLGVYVLRRLEFGSRQLTRDRRHVHYLMPDAPDVDVARALIADVMSSGTRRVKASEVPAAMAEAWVTEHAQRLALDEARWDRNEVLAWVASHTS